MNASRFVVSDDHPMAFPYLAKTAEKRFRSQKD
jgi:hypothetical protein